MTAATLEIGGRLKDAVMWLALAYAVAAIYRGHK